MKLIAALALLMLATAPTLAASCRGEKGKFIKCPPATSAAATGITKDAKGRCHAAGGKFVACPK